MEYLESHDLWKINSHLTSSWKIEPGISIDKKETIGEIDAYSYTGKRTITNEFGKRTENFVLPKENIIKSFIITYRLFIQDNSSISLRKMDTEYHPKLPIAEDLKREFSRIRQEINMFLDQVVTDFTYRQIIDKFIYGEFAHSKPSKRKWIEDQKKRSNYERNLMDFLKGVHQVTYALSPEKH
ncbi:MAG: hypothetical protein ACFFBD_02080 [Candidatus Hodarchaeota archaeon]